MRRQCGILYSKKNASSGYLGPRTYLAGIVGELRVFIWLELSKSAGCPVRGSEGQKPTILENLYKPSNCDDGKSL